MQNTVLDSKMCFENVMPFIVVCNISDGQYYIYYVKCKFSNLIIWKS